MMFRTPSPIPIYLCPMREQMLRQAGRIADGAVLSAGISIATVKKSLSIIAAGALEAGRDASALHKSCFISFIASEDKRKAVDIVRQKLAFMFRNKFLDENIALTGVQLDQQAIIAAMSKRDYEGAAKLISDEAVDAFAVAGSIRDCCDKLQRFADTGLNELVLLMAGGVEDQRFGLKVLKEFS